MHIIGHHKQREFLRVLAQAERMAQAYLFAGPQGTGKGLVARGFAYALVGEPDFVPSDEQSDPVDVMVLRPEDETKKGVTKEKSIRTEDVRDAITFLGRFPSRGRYRVVIIEEAHKLSLSAQNALLKTLEEPSSTAVLILVTHDGAGLVPTILSRVQRVRFGFVPEEEMVAGIGSLFPGRTGEVASFFYSLGRPGMVIRALRDPVTFAEERERLGSLFRISSLSLPERLSLAETLSRNVPQAVRLLEWWLPGLHAQARKSKEGKSASRFFGFLEAVTETLALLKTTQSNARLLLEKLFLSIS